MLSLAKWILNYYKSNDEDPINIYSDDEEDSKIRQSCPDLKLPFDLKYNIYSMIKRGDPSTRIFRDMCKGLITNEYDWANNNGQSMLAKFKILYSVKSKNIKIF